MKENDADATGPDGEAAPQNETEKPGAHEGPPDLKQAFMSVWQAAALLDCAEKGIYHSIQEGRMPLAFDIARPGGGRLCVRVAASSVQALKRHSAPPEDFGQFLAQALPKTLYSYKPPQLARFFQCDPDHIYHLIAAKELEDVGGATRYRVPRESLIRFLIERRIT